MLVSAEFTALIVNGRQSLGRPRLPFAAETTPERGGEPTNWIH
jgi:hypothetical protein